MSIRFIANIHFIALAATGLLASLPAHAQSQNNAAFTFNPETGLYEHATIQDAPSQGEEAASSPHDGAYGVRAEPSEQAGERASGGEGASPVVNEPQTQQTIHVNRNARRAHDSQEGDPHRIDFAPDVQENAATGLRDNQRSRAAVGRSGDIYGGWESDGSYGVEDNGLNRRNNTGAPGNTRAKGNRDAYQELMGTVTPGAATYSGDDTGGQIDRSELDQYSSGVRERQQRYRDEDGYDAEFGELERRDRSGYRYNTRNSGRSDSRRQSDDDYGYNNDEEAGYFTYREGGSEYSNRHSATRASEPKTGNRDAYQEMMSQIGGNK